MLTIVADFVGIVGGWIVARFQLQVASGLYWSSILQALYMQDVWMGLIKPFVLGFVIVSVACHVGLRTTGGTQGVGKATTVAVVAGSVGVIAVDFFVTRVLISLIVLRHGSGSVGHATNDRAGASRRREPRRTSRSSCSTTCSWRSTTRSC